MRTLTFLDRAQRSPARACPETEGRAVRCALGILRVYKRWVSPCLPSACRYHPTCSEYMMEAIEKHGVARGVWMGSRRLLRCHPFHEGGFDPVR